jgi:hypothetical protein
MHTLCLQNDRLLIIENQKSSQEKVNTCPLIGCLRESSNASQKINKKTSFSDNPKKYQSDFFLFLQMVPLKIHLMETCQHLDSQYCYFFKEYLGFGGINFFLFLVTNEMNGVH